MNTVAQKCMFSIRLDSLKNEPQKIDKTLLKSPLWNILEKGMTIEVTERNKRGFIKDFKLIRHGELGDKGGDGITHTSNNPFISPYISPPSSSNLKETCLLIAFSHFAKNPALWGFKSEIVMAIDNAHRLYNEVKEEWK